jgi:hypothetical protein
MDNAKPHNSEKSVQHLEDSKPIRMPHPANPPDIAPSDFYLFGIAIQWLQTSEGRSLEELGDNVCQTLRSIAPDE